MKSLLNLLHDVRNKLQDRSARAGHQHRLNNFRTINHHAAGKVFPPYLKVNPEFFLLKHLVNPGFPESLNLFFLLIQLDNADGFLQKN